jgi:hypothetical protein
MGWSIPWYTVIDEDFQKACGTTECFALDVFLRDGERVFLTTRPRAGASRRSAASGRSST